MLIAVVLIDLQHEEVVETSPMRGHVHAVCVKIPSLIPRNTQAIFEHRAFTCAHGSCP